jgi:RND family efflux transporter MFP subunit
VATANANVATTKARFGQADADVAEAKAQVKLAEAERDKAKVQVDFATIRADFDGVVTLRSFHEGGMVRAVSEGGQTPLLAIDEIDTMRVVVLVPNQDVDYVKVGQPAFVEIDGLIGKKLPGMKDNWFPAIVSAKANAEDPQTRLMRVEVKLPNPTGAIKSGMYGRVKIILTHPRTLSIPTSCLVGPAENRQVKVFVVRGDHAQLTQVLVGVKDGQRIEVIDGLTAQDAVIRYPARGLEDGAPVTVAPAPIPTDGSEER